ncbi:NAD(P)/FAD-dependent oxidoreductase [Mycoplasmopsis lipofaciens]|uniref:NAD(P)/FAD-dependent oxidoreductase n=1 Tax=Mycoplasmopsis lipofaciens TaxID=114884 RepID=UPI00055A4B39|nr:FAD-dependent oxidoreductase [Mycoplasmopsis lipofaciens]
MYDIAIIGAGPGGLNCALYASRAGLKVVFIEKAAPGGKLSATSKIENWLGTELIEGYELAIKTFNHAQKFGAEYKFGNVIDIQHINDLEQKVILEDKNEILAKTVVIATGMENREPTFINGYEKFKHKGISFCATCDAPFYKGQDVAVLGGGNSAVEESVFLANIVNHIYLIVKDNFFHAEKMLVDNLKNIKNITIFMESQIKEIKGNNAIESIIIETKNKGKQEIKVQGFFPFIGFVPNDNSFKNLNIANEFGFIETNENMETKVNGIYAIGDIRDKKVRQIITAASDGAIAAKSISEKILNQGVI